MDFAVDLACLHQRIVLADAHHMSVVQHDNLVGVAQGRGALGDDEERRFRGQGAQGFAERGIRGVVQRGGAVVQNQIVRR